MFGELNQGGCNWQGMQYRDVIWLQMYTHWNPWLIVGGEPRRAGRWSEVLTILGIGPAF